jgi:hypothetical protein
VNKSRENRVVISGLARVTPGLTTHQDKKTHYLKLISDLIDKALPEHDPKPIPSDVVVSLHRNQALPSVEVRLDTVGGALSFRKAASSLAKGQQDPDFANLYFSNSVTQATRVRVEILKAIAKRLTTDTETAFVQSYVSRPVLRYVSEESTDASVAASGTGRSYSFADAVSRFGDLLFDSDLAKAYKRAGGTFRGAMEQYFVVLREAEDISITSGANQVPLGGQGASVSRGSGRSPPSRRGRRGSRFSPLRGGRGFGIRGRKRQSGTPPGTPNKRRNT